MNGFGCRIQQASESNARHGGKFGCTSRTQSRRIPQVYEHSQIFPAVSQATCQCENGLVNGKAEAPPVLSFGEVALFRIFAKATSFRRSENPPSGPVEVALFRIKGKENYRWLRLETLFHRATV